jgi:hypothetical protein
MTMAEKNEQQKQTKLLVSAKVKWSPSKTASPSKKWKKGS